MVTRKKTRNIKSSGTSSPQESVPSRQVQGINGFVVRTVDGPNHQAQHASEGGPSSSGLEKAENQKGKHRRSPKGVSKASVNGKKDLIRARLHKAWSVEGNIT